MPKPLVYLCMPRYSNQVHAEAIMSLLCWPTDGSCTVYFGEGTEKSPDQVDGSLLTHVFNRLWCNALNMRDMYKITHFAMLHADVQAEPGWVDKLVAEQQRLKADVVSAVVPLKMTQGLTSTGLGFAGAPRDHAGSREGTRKLTLAEIDKLPETFCAADTDEPEKVLLVNTGCWVCDFTKPWVENFCFQIFDRIYRCPTLGKYHSETRGEDWNMSYHVHDVGGRVFATKKVKTVHHGSFGYANWPVWGHWTEDKFYLALKEQVELGRAKFSHQSEIPAPATA